jgi:tetratricopeptide (TPR) repeat protein
VGRLLRPALLTAAALALAVGLTLVAAIALGGRSGPLDAVGPSAAPAVGVAGRPGVAGDVASLQARLKAVPGDHRAWSSLALAYVEQARVTADPSYYARADRAVAEAARRAPGDAALLTATASLAAARHDFTAALAAADEAVAANPSGAVAHEIRSDALTELGRYGAARRAATRADDLDPGPSTFARLSYAAELRGDLREATRLMRLARDTATGSAPAYAFASFHLGEIARSTGDPAAAARHYDDALAADPTYSPALAGRARLAVADGDVEAALRHYNAVVTRLPLPEYVVELAELYESLGRDEEARQQYAVAEASAALARENGVGVDLEVALFEADHGSPVAAVAAARAEWEVRQSVHTADALGWALHAAGRDREALTYVRQATRLGTRDARMLFHHGAVAAALGLDGEARSHLEAALAVDNGVAPLREGMARDLLDRLGGGR